MDMSFNVQIGKRKGWTENYKHVSCHDSKQQQQERNIKNISSFLALKVFQGQKMSYCGLRYSWEAQREGR